ncbi:spore germination protein [Paenibacillus sp. GP183]|uniref:spore germination protein n=1 Tax=Paenibacillus sp. GP183 TaxID=1882751 RepID=UPI00089A2CFC|nr:spore germination protein [Paenibacillus sp. GP183]SEB50199.1 spore germination protein PF [Paenibacillus sp. GP183]
MPSFAGAVKVVSNVGSFIYGDNLVVSPTVSLKTYEGSGSSNVGDFRIDSNLFSATATVDSDLVDSGSNKIATGT